MRPFLPSYRFCCFVASGSLVALGALAGCGKIASDGPNPQPLPPDVVDSGPTPSNPGPAVDAGPSIDDSGQPVVVTPDSGTVGPVMSSDGGAFAGQPPPSTGLPSATATPQNFALHTLQLGDMTRTGTANTDAWASYGYNLDGKITTIASTDVCTLYQGTPASVQVDGNAGIDNSFGENLLPLIETVAGSGIDVTENTAINAGAFTVMFDISGLTTSPTQTNTAVGAQVFLGATFTNGAPSWTTADDWPVVASSLANPASIAGGAEIVLPTAYVVDGLWVSGDPIATLPVELAIEGQPLILNVHQAVVTMQHDAPSHMTNGTIAGVLSTQELIMGLQAVAGHLSISLCQGGAFDSIATQIEQDSDILSDGTNAPGTPCDAISIGLGFTADEIGAPAAIAAPVPPTPNPCGDAG